MYIYIEIIKIRFEVKQKKLAICSNNYFGLQQIYVVVNMC